MMAATSVIVVGLSKGIVALTALERLEAMRRLNTNFMTQRWFVVTGVAAIIILTILFFVVSYHQRSREKRTGKRFFDEYAEKRGVNGRERQILLDMAGKAGLRQNEGIFTMERAFDIGAERILEESLGRQSPEESRRLRIELFFLREKLGFQKSSSASASLTMKLRKMSSRQIPVGKKCYITRRKSRDSDSIESTVMKNDYAELTIEMAKPVETAAGEVWLVRYYFGASAWEFESSVQRSDGKVLVLNHTDNVRFINRRRFLRVSVNKSGFIAPFPFARMVGKGGDKRGVTSEGWLLPEFVPAIVTELAGCGLRIKAPLEVKAGDKVLVVFQLEEEQKRDDSNKEVNEQKAPAAKIVQDIGEVRHTTVIPNGLLIAVELIGLRDSDISELIRATNAASLEAVIESEGGSDSGDSERLLREPVIVQGT
jgi:hypothetical protein